MKGAGTRARNHSGTRQHGTCTRRRGMMLAFAIIAHSEQEHSKMTLLKSADQHIRTCECFHFEIPYDNSDSITTKTSNTQPSRASAAWVSWSKSGSAVKGGII